VNNVDAVRKIHGSNGWRRTKEYSRGLLVEGTDPDDSNLLALRDRELTSLHNIHVSSISHDFTAPDGPHALRRKIWDKGFSTKALAEYHPFLLKRTQELVQRLSERANQVVDMYEWAGYFVYE
jgi:cytochrome P450